MLKNKLFKKKMKKKIIVNENRTRVKSLEGIYVTTTPSQLDFLLKNFNKILNFYTAVISQLFFLYFCSSSIHILLIKLAPKPIPAPRTKPLQKSLDCPFSKSRTRASIFSKRLFRSLSSKS